MRVPFLDLQQVHRQLKGEILAAWEPLLDSAAFVGGETVERFEQAFAAAHGVEHCVAVSNGTDALRLAILALGIEPGDEIITVPNTFIATTEAITQAGAQVALVDVAPDTLLMDPAMLAGARTTRTRGIIPVHLYGQMADMDSIMDFARKWDLWVLEDAAQSQLAGYKEKRSGSIGHAAATSFYPGKNLGACGEAGAVTTGDAQVAEAIRRLRNHGQSAKNVHPIEGYNARCDALQAAALSIKLAYLPEWNAQRREAAALYFELLSGIDGVTVPHIDPRCEHVFHLYVVQVDQRDRVIERLAAEGVQTGIHYPVPLHLQGAYRHLPYGAGDFPVAEDACARIVSLPMFPGITQEMVRYVCRKLEGALG